MADYPTPWKAVTHTMGYGKYAGAIVRDTPTRRESRRCGHLHKSRVLAAHCATRMLDTIEGATNA